MRGPGQKGGRHHARPGEGLQREGAGDQRPRRRRLKPELGQLRQQQRDVPEAAERTEVRDPEGAGEEQRRPQPQQPRRDLGRELDRAAARGVVGLARRAGGLVGHRAMIPFRPRGHASPHHRAGLGARGAHALVAPAPRHAAAAPLRRHERGRHRLPRGGGQCRGPARVRPHLGRSRGAGHSHRHRVGLGEPLLLRPHRGLPAPRFRRAGFRRAALALARSPAPW